MVTMFDFQSGGEESVKRIKSCMLRAENWGRADVPFDTSHPLSILWENIKWLLSGSGGTVEDYRYDLHLLDYMAYRVGEHLKSHKGDGDIQLGRILHEWKVRVLTIFDPRVLKTDQRA